MALSKKTRIDALEKAIKMLAQATVPGHPSSATIAEQMKAFQQTDPEAAKLISDLINWGETDIPAPPTN